MPEFLLEIGCEEMPASWLPGLTEQMRERFADLCEKEFLAAETVEGFSTPRRLGVVASVPARQPDREEDVWGPSMKVARDERGGWTGAAAGFARKNGVRPEDLRHGPKD